MTGEKKLKAFKSFEDYRLFADGHVEKLLHNPVSPTSEVSVSNATARPTQKDKTYLNKSTYSPWIVMSKESRETCECGVL